MKKLKRKRAKKKITIWALDTEDDSKGKVHLLNFYDGNKHYTFTSPKDAQKFMASLEGKNIIWATNLQYDLINTFVGSLYHLEIGYVGSRVISAKITDTDTIFYDTLNHWKISVEEMGNRIGLKKLDPNGNFNNIAYCQRDTEITFKFVDTMRIHYESIGCDLKATIGSTALRFFQTRYYKMQREQIFKTRELKFMLKGYFGGRTEIFYNSPVEGNIQYFDFNSLYPSVMKMPFPIIKKGMFQKTKILNLKNEGIACVRVETPSDLNVPYLPLRSSTGGLIFPLGSFKGYWTYFELREAQKIGYKITRVYNCLEFSAGTSFPFNDFVDDLYGKRNVAKAAKDELLSEAYKLLMNNLYGKYGQGNEYTKLIPHKRGMKLKKDDEILGDMVLRKEKGAYPAHTNVIWAAYVTAYGRHKLWEGMREVEKKGGLLIYCDTDSIIFESNKRIFDDSNALGALKSEGKFEYAHFKLPKLYKLVESGGKAKYRSKGVPRKHAEEFFEKGRAHFKKPYKLRETLRRNLNPKRKIKLIANFWDDTEKVTHKTYDKRIVNENGTTKPHRIGRISKEHQ